MVYIIKNKKTKKKKNKKNFKSNSSNYLYILLTSVFLIVGAGVSLYALRNNNLWKKTHTDTFKAPTPILTDSFLLVSDETTQQDKEKDLLSTEYKRHNINLIDVSNSQYTETLIREHKISLNKDNKQDVIQNMLKQYNKLGLSYKLFLLKNDRDIQDFNTNKSNGSKGDFMIMDSSDSLNLDIQKGPSMQIDVEEQNAQNQIVTKTKNYHIFNFNVEYLKNSNYAPYAVIGERQFVVKDKNGIEQKNTDGTPKKETKQVAIIEPDFLKSENKNIGKKYFYQKSNGDKESLTESVYNARIKEATSSDKTKYTTEDDFGSVYVPDIDKEIKIKFSLSQVFSFDNDVIIDGPNGTKTSVLQKILDEYSFLNKGVSNPKETDYNQGHFGILFEYSLLDKDDNPVPQNGIEPYTTTSSTPMPSINNTNSSRVTIAIRVQDKAININNNSLRETT